MEELSLGFRPASELALTCSKVCGVGEALEEHELVGYAGVLRGDVMVLGLSPTRNGKIQDNGYPSLK